MTVEQKAEEYYYKKVFAETNPQNETELKERFLQSFIAGYHECQKEHEWHDLRKDPTDLPKDKHDVWCKWLDQYSEGWYDKDTNTWTLIYRGYHLHCIEAWCELPTFDKE